MPLGTNIRNNAARVSANIGLRDRLDDDVDDAAIYVEHQSPGAPLLLRIDPRDVRRPADNPTGAKRYHHQWPGRDLLRFSGTGTVVGPVTGKYAGQPVFSVTPGVGSAANTDITVEGQSINGLTSFTVIGMADLAPSMMGTSGFHVIYCHYRDSAGFEMTLAHQFAGGVDYLTLFADQGDGNGLNYNLTTGGLITPGVPFMYAMRVKPVSTTQSQISLWFNGALAANRAIDGAVTTIAETGTLQTFLGHGTDSSQQMTGALGRHYVFGGDAMATADGVAAVHQLALQMKNLYGIA